MAQIILDSNSNLIQGDFDSATVNDRTKLQTSTVNATTGVYVVPNGTATSASVQIANNSNLTNASKVVVATNGSTDTQIVSGANGSGTYLPLSFYTNNDIRFQMGTAGELNVRTAPGTVSSGTSGQFLTSNGPGAGVSWTTAPTPPSPQIQTELFTGPGTWTCPATTTQVKVTVIGGSGSHSPTGGLSGNTSSFGPAVSATGGTGTSVPATSGTPGSGTVSVGTALKTGAINSIGQLAGPASDRISLGNIIQGAVSFINPSPSARAYSTSSLYMAGASSAIIPGTPFFSGSGGFAIAIVPVSAPVTVTVGAGAPSPTTSGGGNNGAVLVEWIG